MPKQQPTVEQVKALIAATEAYFVYEDALIVLAEALGGGFGQVVEDTVQVEDTVRVSAAFAIAAGLSNEEYLSLLREKLAVLEASFDTVSNETEENNNQ